MALFARSSREGQAAQLEEFEPEGLDLGQHAVQRGLAAALVLAGAAALTGGGLAARTAGRPVLRGALRQLLLGVAAVGIAYLACDLAWAPSNHRFPT